MTDEQRLQDIRLDSAGQVDEVVIRDAKFFHLERMDEGHWWLVVERRDGTKVHVNLSAKRPGRTRVDALVDVDPPGQAQRERAAALDGFAELVRGDR